MKGPVARGTQRFSRLSSQLPREWDFQLRKTLSKFFQIFWLEVFWRVSWWLVSITKNACFVFRRQFFKNFFNFSLKFLWLFTVFPTSLSTETDLNNPCHPPQTPFLHHLILRSSRKRYGFSLSHLNFHVSSSILLIFELSLCFEIYYVRNFFLFRLMCLGWLFLLLISFANHNLFSLY